eukprot:TRINITY_DN2655_c0_g1_i2.p1 TRINITY_DN2655_c0_g1~~TRINITY_DN2655_c0_g1_i2.p1  ORF type:complete len:289 (-),score=47.81 TRINITY_DN2655_c0_g1_i2:24-830(-)
MDGNAAGEKRCLVFEWMDNGSVEDRLALRGGTAPLSWQRRVLVARDSARGLAFLHSQTPPLIHRYLKSANILLDREWTAHIADFGRARPVSDLATQATRPVSSWVLCSLGYLDPAFSTSGDLDEASDVYSFGVVILELLTGLPAVDPASGEPNLVAQWRSRQGRRSASSGGESSTTSNNTSSSSTHGARHLRAARLHLSGSRSTEAATAESPGCASTALIDMRAGEWPEEAVAELSELARVCLLKNRSKRPTAVDINERLEVVARTAN